MVLFPKSHIIEFIELLIIFKISLSGATFFYFLKEHFVLLGKDNRYHDNTFVPAFVLIIHLCRHLFFLRHMRFPAL